MNTMQNTTRWLGFALACSLLGSTLTADAKKPVPPPPDDPPAAAAYDVVWLGEPGTQSIATNINESGLVVGIFDGRPTLVVPEDDNGSLVWSKDDDLDGRNDLLRDLGLPEGTSDASPRKINDHGAILIIGYDGQGYSLWILAPRVVDGQLTWTDLDSEGVNWQIAPLPVLATANPDLEIIAGGINNHGEVVLTIDGRGYLLVPDHYEVSPDGAVTVGYPDEDLDGDGLSDYLIDLGLGVSAWVGQDPPLQPVAINDQGDVAGTVKGEGFHDLPFVIRPRQDESGGLIWNEDEDGDGVNDLAIYLPLPRGDDDANVSDMNENGTIVGDVGGSREGWRAAIWEMLDWETGLASVTQLGTAINKYETSWAEGVNAAGLVVGRSEKSNWPDFPVNSEKLWLYDQGEMVSVADLVPPESGFADGESWPFSINDSGLIVGKWWTENYNVPTAFLMIPAAGQ